MRLILTSPEQHPSSKMPAALRHLLYSNDELLSLIDFSGCPNSGCEHTLSISGERRDILGWLDLFVDAYPGVRDEAQAIKKAIRAKFLNDPDCNFSIKLKDIQRGVLLEGKIVRRPWFWTPEWEIDRVY